jgi:hypothetical protein
MNPRANSLMMYVLRNAHAKGCPELTADDVAIHYGTPHPTSLKASVMAVRRALRGA